MLATDMSLMNCYPSSLGIYLPFGRFAMISLSHGIDKEKPGSGISTALMFII